MPIVRPLLLTDPLSAEPGPSCPTPRLPGPIWSVASPANGSGKTSLACALASALPGSTAIKFTTVRKDGSRCPRSARSCACHSLQGDYTIIDDLEVILQPGTDTCRLAAAGARHVLWCLARPDAYEPLLADLSTRLDHGPVITEGNSVLSHLTGARVLFVLRPEQPPDRFKTSTFALLKLAEAVVLNGPPEGPMRFPWEDREPAVGARLHAELERRRVVRTDLSEPFPTSLLTELGFMSAKACPRES
jgi:hypothetical protein